MSGIATRAQSAARAAGAPARGPAVARALAPRPPARQQLAAAAAAALLALSQPCAAALAADAGMFAGMTDAQVSKLQAAEDTFQQSEVGGGGRRAGSLARALGRGRTPRPPADAAPRALCRRCGS